MDNIDNQTDWENNAYEFRITSTLQVALGWFRVKKANTKRSEDKAENKMNYRIVENKFNFGGGDDYFFTNNNNNKREDEPEESGSFDGDEAEESDENNLGVNSEDNGTEDAEEVEDDDDAIYNQNDENSNERGREQQDDAIEEQYTNDEEENGGGFPSRVRDRMRDRFSGLHPGMAARLGQHRVFGRGGGLVNHPASLRLMLEDRRFEEMATMRMMQQGGLRRRPPRPPALVDENDRKRGWLPHKQMEASRHDSIVSIMDNNPKTQALMERRKSQLKRLRGKYGDHFGERLARNMSSHLGLRGERPFSLSILPAKDVTERNPRLVQKYERQTDYQPLPMVRSVPKYPSTSESRPDFVETTRTMPWSRNSTIRPRRPPVKIWYYFADDRDRRNRFPSPIRRDRSRTTRLPPSRLAIVGKWLASR